ncbi:MAG: hypothetical protein LBS37_01270 [Treponema sp.]|jgi:hypothetical protein|nr:hypothetical protein [Treponema sp.]
MPITDEKVREANRERQRIYRERHREELNEKRKEQYNRRIAAGKCPRCGGKAKKGRALCEKCCEYQGELNRKYAAERKVAAPKTTAAVKPSKAPAAKPKKTRPELAASAKPKKAAPKAAAVKAKAKTSAAKPKTKANVKK